MSGGETTTSSSTSSTNSKTNLQKDVNPSKIDSGAGAGNVSKLKSKFESGGDSKSPAEFFKLRKDLQNKPQEPSVKIKNNVPSSSAQKQALNSDLSLQDKVYKPSVKDPKLLKIVNKIYRPGAKIGTGSTADALRHELQTGKTVGGTFHAMKVKENVSAIKGWIQNNKHTSNVKDMNVANILLKDLEKAISGK